MSCNQEFFQKEEQVIRTSGYASNVLAGFFVNVDFWTYTASTDEKYHINKKQHRLEVPSGDGLYDTFEKTQMAFRLLIEAGFEFDYILRTNLSTHVNVWMLRKFINGIPEEESETVFSTRVYCDRYASGPEEYSFYAVGNSIILSRDKVVTIAYADIEDAKKVNKVPLDEKQTIYHIDDNAIGLILNIDAISKNKDPRSQWKQYASLGMLTPENMTVKNVSSFITIPFRAYNVKNREEKEFWVAGELSKLTRLPLNADELTPEKVYKINAKYDLITLVDFLIGKSLFLKREELAYFLEDPEKFSHDIFKFIDFCKLNFDYKI